MRFNRFLITTCAAGCLASGLAAAQTTPKATPAKAVAASAAGVNTTVAVDANGDRHYLITSSPVPDTPENRARYGQPLSNAGRRTAPIGN
jgi:hypothetical protein